MNTINPVQVVKVKNTSPAINKNKAVTIDNPFLQKFEKIKSDEVKNHAKDLYDKIAEKSDKIGDKLYIQDLVDYKKLVKEFLDVVVTNAHTFSKENFLDRRGRHRVLAKVKNVDRELAGLTHDFLRQEADRLSVIKKLDDIRGILLDIVM